MRKRRKRSFQMELLKRIMAAFVIGVLVMPQVCSETFKISLLSSITRGKGMFFAGAFFCALDDVNNNTALLPNITLQYFFADTKMDPLESIRAMTSHYESGTIGYIGPEGSCACEATNAAAWNLPMIAYKCHDSSISRYDEGDEESLRNTFARTQPSTAKVSKSIMSILQDYQWKRFTMVVGTLAIWNETADSLVDLSKLNNVKVDKLVHFKEPYASRDETYDVVEKTYQHARIYVFLGDNHALIDFVRCLRLLTGSAYEEYVVIAVDDRLYTRNPQKYMLKTPYEDENDWTDDNIQAFRSVMLLVPRPTTSESHWKSFVDKVRLRNSHEPINGPDPYFLDSQGVNLIQVPIYAAYLYDAVLVYARGLHEVISSGGSPRDGIAITNRTRSRTFTSILGHEVYIDKYGDAEGNYSILTLKIQDQGMPDLEPVGSFQMTGGGDGIPVLTLYGEIDWASGEPPPDEPPCGFYGEKCKHEFDWKTVMICGIVAAVALVAGGFALRHYLYEQKLARLLWKIDYKDVVLIDSVEEIHAPTKRKGALTESDIEEVKRSRGHIKASVSGSPGRRSHPWRFLLSYDNEPERTTLLGHSTKDEKSTGSAEGAKRVTIGSYKGTLVAVKHVTKKHFEISRNLKKELQLRKELTHDNINRFVGACVDTPHVRILAQYCARGSLEDILKNEDLNLDEMFISSLVSDLIKGMIFIHDSEIGTHGNLKSSNCLVDSRWVLQIADFGLHHLVNERSGSLTDMDKYYKGLVTKSPELLRDPNRDPKGTQKGDVYAFALILYEMHGRKGPWGECGLTNKEITERVKDYNIQCECPFRPSLDVIVCEDFVKQCLSECWNEEPDLRPDFKFIRYRLKPMQQGLKSNIFDNMLAMMEKYAHNLESLVAERTEQLSEEKKMTENLLLRMLPRFVADQLKRGKPVIPESYDCVSIYFSDIVGFTALSAESTPLQVVGMLNDLYTCFDSVIESFDVYKIETIGDAYMVVSGLPIRNDDLHAGEIASMALELLKTIKRFVIRHRPHDTMKLRIGIHSGPCVAGVVGLKMPRYTLFGDTVNTASRMETTGVPLKIHISAATKVLLDKLGGYTTVERGYVSAKGKGEMLTYFLEGEDTLERTRRISQTKTGKFSRQGSPMSRVGSDLGGDPFGANTILPRYLESAQNLFSLTSSPSGNDLHIPVRSVSQMSSFSCDNKTVSTPLSPMSNISCDSDFQTPTSVPEYVAISESDSGFQSALPHSKHSRKNGIVNIPTTGLTYHDNHIEEEDGLGESSSSGNISAGPKRPNCLERVPLILRSIPQIYTTGVAEELREDIV